MGLSHDCMYVCRCQSKGVVAFGRKSGFGNRFTVFAGSTAATKLTDCAKTTPKRMGGGFVELRERLIKGEKVLKPHGGVLRFVCDYSFASPSTASSIVLGNNSDGMRDWKPAV